jgi:uncharacterized protein YeaO (DUF488 family)
MQLLEASSAMTPHIPADHVRLKRAYLPASPDDGMRVLVDRLWPRGISKARAALAYWNKDVPPTTGLRQWFGHDPARWDEFCTRYRAELKANPERSRPWARWRGKAGSPWSSVRGTKRTTKPSSCVKSSWAVEAAIRIIRDGHPGRVWLKQNAAHKPRREGQRPWSRP